MFWQMCVCLSTVVPIIHWISLYRAFQTCPLYKTRGPLSDTWWWPVKLKHVRLFSGLCTSYWNTFLWQMSVHVTFMWSSFDVKPDFHKMCGLRTRAERQCTLWRATVSNLVVWLGFEMDFSLFLDRVLDISINFQSLGATTFWNIKCSVEIYKTVALLHDESWYFYYIT